MLLHFISALHRPVAAAAVGAVAAVVAVACATADAFASADVDVAWEESGRRLRTSPSGTADWPSSTGSRGWGSRSCPR